MKQLQLAIATDIEKELPRQILFNYDEISSGLAALLKKYDGLVITEDDLKDGKATRADLNRLKKALSDARIDAKKRWLEPFTEFESRINELVAMIDKPLLAIDEQVKAHQEQERKERREAIEAFYETNASKEVIELVPFERILDSKWLNKSMPITSATNELHAILTKIRNDIKLIRAMDEVDVMLDEYLRTLDMSDALAARKRVEEQKITLEKINRAAESIKTEKSTEIADEPVAQSAPPTIESAHETPKDIGVKFYGTTAAFRAEMKALTQKHGIKYTEIKKEVA